MFVRVHACVRASTGQKELCRAQRLEHACCWVGVVIGLQRHMCAGLCLHMYSRQVEQCSTTAGINLGLLLGTAPNHKLYYAKRTRIVVCCRNHVACTVRIVASTALCQLPCVCECVCV